MSDDTNRLHAVARARVLDIPPVDPTIPIPRGRSVGTVDVALISRGLTEDDVFSWIAIEAASMREIAVSLAVSKSAVAHWLHASPARSARADAAWRAASDAKAEEALEILRAAREDKTMTRAQASMVREIAHHLRWEASVRNRDRYGDHVRVDQRVQVGRGAAQMTDAELLEIAKKNGVSGPIIDGWAEQVAQGVDTSNAKDAEISDA